VETIAVGVEKYIFLRCKNMHAKLANKVAIAAVEI